MKTIFALLALSTLALTGCASGGDSKPKDSFNSKITGPARNALTGQTAIFEYGKSMGQRPSGAFSVMSQLAASTVPGMSPSQQAIQQKSQILANAVHNGDCPMDIANPGGQTGASDPQAVNFPRMRIVMKGPSCPLEMDMDFSIAGGQSELCSEDSGATNCNFTGRVKMSYRVVDAKLRQELGTSAGVVAMTFDIKKDIQGDGGPDSGMDMKMAVKTNFEMKAIDLESKSQLVTGNQDIKLKLLMQGPPAGGELPSSPRPVPQPQVSIDAQENVQYLNEVDGISSKLSANIKGAGKPGTQKYFVDGQIVTAKAYQLEREKFANSMIAFGPEQKEQGASPSSYVGPEGEQF